MFSQTQEKIQQELSWASEARKTERHGPLKRQTFAMDGIQMYIHTSFSIANAQHPRSAVPNPTLCRSEPWTEVIHLSAQMGSAHHSSPLS